MSQFHLVPDEQTAIHAEKLWERGDALLAALVVKVRGRGLVRGVAWLVIR